jgi:lipopolysaccharide/colanic/teichoic acid biosynthesis glycosyltransferase
MELMPMYTVIKRVMDFVIATILVVAFSPLFLLIAVLIKIDSRGPVFFRQERVGKNGKIFRIFKFRSMVSDNDMRDFSSRDKYTFVGKIIRRLSLDELPQLFNVLRGEMSLVGPRPWVVEYWTNMNKEERVRASVLPGITGLAQVKGRNGISIFSKIEYDIIYVKNFSFRQDVKILILTVLTVLSGRGLDAGKEGVMDDIRNLRQS